MTPVSRASHLCAPGRLNPEPRSSDPTPTPLQPLAQPASLSFLLGDRLRL